jgi:hypothetical protein
MSDTRCVQPGCTGAATDGFLCIDHFMALPLFLRMNWLMHEFGTPGKEHARELILTHIHEVDILKGLGF